MKKHLILLAAAFLSVALLLACGRAPEPAYVEPATTALAITTEVPTEASAAEHTTETEISSTEAPSTTAGTTVATTMVKAIKTVAASSSPPLAIIAGASPLATTADTTTSITQYIPPAPISQIAVSTQSTTTTTEFVPPAPPPQAVAATQPATTATSTSTMTTTQYVPPAVTQQTTTATTTTTTTQPISIVRNNGEYEVMGADYTNRILAGVNKQRGENGAGPAGISQTLNETSLEQAKRMAEAGREFHSATTPGCESVGRFPCEFMPAETIGEMLALHVSDFRQARVTVVGIGVIRTGDYVYVVMQG